MYFKSLSYESTLKGNFRKYYQAVADVSRWHIWNPNILHSTLDSPFAEGAHGMTMPKLSTFSPMRIRKIIENQYIEFDVITSLGRLNVQYEFIKESENSTRVKINRSIYGIVGIATFLIKGRAYRKNFDLLFPQLEKHVLSMK